MFASVSHRAYENRSEGGSARRYFYPCVCLFTLFDERFQGLDEKMQSILDDHGRFQGELMQTVAGVARKLEELAEPRQPTPKKMTHTLIARHVSLQSHSEDKGTVERQAERVLEIITSRGQQERKT